MLCGSLPHLIRIIYMFRRRRGRAVAKCKAHFIAPWKPVKWPIPRYDTLEMFIQIFSLIFQYCSIHTHTHTVQYKMKWTNLNILKSHLWSFGSNFGFKLSVQKQAPDLLARNNGKFSLAVCSHNEIVSFYLISLHATVTMHSTFHQSFLIWVFNQLWLWFTLKYTEMHDEKVNSVQMKELREKNEKLVSIYAGLENKLNIILIFSAEYILLNKHSKW